MQNSVKQMKILFRILRCGEKNSSPLLTRKRDFHIEFDFAKTSVLMAIFLPFTRQGPRGIFVVAWIFFLPCSVKSFHCKDAKAISGLYNLYDAFTDIFVCRWRP